MTTTPKDDLPEARILPEPEREKLLKIIAAQRDFLQAYRKGKYELYSMSPEVRDAAIKCLPCSEGPLDRAERDALKSGTRTPAIADGVGVEEENRALRGTLEYILRQAQLNHPGALTVIRMNAQAALNREWQKTVKQAMNDLLSTPPQAATDEG